MNELSKEEAIDFLSLLYGGQHHIPSNGKIQRFGNGWSINHEGHEFSTYDYNYLTKMVVLAHDKCIRVGIRAVRNGIIQLTLFKRTKEGSISERHPNLESHVEKIRLSLKDQS